MNRWEIIFALVFGVGGFIYGYLTREEHSHQGHHGPRGERRGAPQGDYGSRPSWGCGDYPEEDDDDDERVRRASRTKETKDEAEKCEKESTCDQPCCPICLETFQFLNKKGIPIYATPCGHLFCEKCLKQAVPTNNRPNPCPTCRIPIQYKNCHPIYL